MFLIQPFQEVRDIFLVKIRNADIFQMYRSLFLKELHIEIDRIPICLDCMYTFLLYIRQIYS